MRMTKSFILGLLFVNTAFAAPFLLQSSEITNNGPIDTAYTCDGKNISPPLRWVNQPPRTQAFALILYNPDAPYGIFYNWIIFNIPSNVTVLPEAANVNLPPGTLVGNTSSGDAIYRGPCPPNSAVHHYIFKIVALDAPLDLNPSADPEEVLTQISNHAIGEAELIGTYAH